MAEKMIPWSIDIENKHISVPESDLELAKENLTVEHICKKFGFFIQSAISCDKKEVFDPKLLNNKPKEKSTLSAEFSVLDKFKVISTGSFLEIKEIKGSSFVLKYTFEKRPDITTTIESIKQQLNLKTWVRI